MTQNIVENPALQDQVIVQDIPEVVERIQERIFDPIEVLPHERVQPFTAEQIVHMSVPQTQEPPVFVRANMIEAVTLLKEIRLHLLKHMASTNTFLLNHLCRRGSAFTTGTLGPDEVRQMLSRNKLQESGVSLPYKKLLNMSNTKSFMNDFT